MQRQPVNSTSLFSTRNARPIVSRVALAVLCATSLFGLSGCAAIESIFKVGVWFGVVVVVAIVAVVGGIAALVMRK